MNVEKVPTAPLFVTKEFKESAWIAALCENVPFLWLCHDEEVPGHFGTYFGCTYARKGVYKNPYIQDLYWLHEIEHVKSFAYDPKASFFQWEMRMFKNEINASLTSEVRAYLYIHGIREKTFPHEIWADRFDGVRHVQQRKGHSSDQWNERAMDSVSKERLRAINAPIPGDFLEMQIRNYNLQTYDWCRIWSEPVGTGRYADEPAFRVVERHMADPDRDETHLEWLEKVSCLELGRGQIPFRKQALAFEQVYKSSIARFGNHLLTR